MLYIDLTVVQSLTGLLSDKRSSLCPVFLLLFTTLPSESYLCHGRCRSLDNPDLTAKEIKERGFFNKDQYSQGEPYNSPRVAFFFDSKSVLLF